MFQDQKPLPLPLYVLGVAAILIAVFIPYFLPLGQIPGYLVVYGVPIVITGAFFGRQILGRAAKNNKDGFKFGLGFFGASYLVGVLLSAVALFIILQFYPSATEILQRPNPVLDVSKDVAWIMIAVSMLVIGPAEEFLFRGFMFGGLLNLSKGKHWILMATISSLMFTFAHGYYLLTYTVASPVYFIQLFAFSMAMCFTYYYSGGNLIAVMVVHGLNNTIGFFGVATTATYGRVAQIAFLSICIAFAIWFVLKRFTLKPYPNQQPDITQQQI